MNFNVVFSRWLILKIVGFQPEAGASSDDKAAYKTTGCVNKDGAAAIHCSGEVKRKKKTFVWLD